jgi:hypothetical protein
MDFVKLHGAIAVLCKQRITGKPYAMPTTPPKYTLTGKAIITCIYMYCEVSRLF